MAILQIAPIGGHELPQIGSRIDHEWLSVRISFEHHCLEPQITQMNADMLLVLLLFEMIIAEKQPPRRLQEILLILLICG